jgi:hypothetical protein
MSNLNKEILELVAHGRLAKNRQGKIIVLKPGLSTAWTDLANAIHTIPSSNDTYSMHESINEENKALENATAEVSDMIADSLGRIVRVIREDVIPTVEDIKQNVEESVNKWMNLQPTGDFTITELSVPSFITSNHYFVLFFRFGFY